MSVLFAILIIALCVFLIANRSYDMLDMDAADIESVNIKDLSTGNFALVTDPIDIESIVSNLNSVKVKRYNPSAAYEKSQIEVIITTKDAGNIRGAFNTFIIESDERLMANDLTYYAVDGTFDIQLFKSFIKQ